MVKIIVLLVGGVLSAILYRLGGAGKCGDCFDILRKSWVRDWLIPPIMLICLALTKHSDIINIFVYLLCWGFMGGALSTYWDWLFGYDNMYAHGAGVGLSTIPLFWTGIHWYSIVIYTVALSVSMGFIRHNIKINNVIQEFIKGALIVVCLPLLTIG